MKSTIDISSLREEKFFGPTLQGYKYQMRFCHRIYNRIILPEDREDFFMAALESGWQSAQSGASPDEIFRAAKNATLREVRKFLRPRVYWWKLKGKEEPKRESISLLRTARVIYAKLKKQGKRGMQSAALKAFIIRERLEGRSYEEIVGLLRGRHTISKESAKKHYQSAVGIVFGVERGNITR